MKKPKIKQTRNVVNVPVGARFGRYVVVGDSDESFKGKHRLKYLRVKCDCGSYGDVPRQRLLKGFSKSCGCLAGEMSAQRLLKHGEARTRLYRLWSGMIRRCEWKGDPKKYALYGARGIKVSKEWRSSYEKFKEDMGEPPDNCTLDRIDVNGDYCKENCRWVSAKEQQRNKRNNIKYEFRGKLVTVREAIEMAGVKRWSTTVLNRLNRGMSLEEAIITPTYKENLSPNVV
jgi:hypothetical protein